MSTELNKFIFTRKEEELLTYMKRLESLRAQRCEQEYALQIQKCVSTTTTSSTSNINEFKLKERINLKKKELSNLKATNLVKDKAIESIEIGRVIINSLYPKELELSLQNSQFNELLNTRDSFVSEFLKSHQELLKVQAEMTKLQQAIIVRQHDNRELMKKIKNIKQSSIDFNSMQSDLSNTMAKIEIVKNVLQGLILESGINWVEDEHLLKLMLKIGNDL
ncbi:8888_t:CDS:2 [Diversispora eburnea]|uniref:8888_t:CDS:1 n=1 Tax=Diversispora eburnea TaxID=1213867 RepID=A0A9N8V889_9GLOM|nr:8888_t:CDS:2 [Diversispora eburnea]